MCEEKTTVDTQASGNEAVQSKKWTKQKTFNVVGIVLCVILIPILIFNCILIVQGIFGDDVPSIGGNTPLIVQSGSMEPTIMTGDLIIVEDVDPQSVEVGDVISFFDPKGNGTAVVTHRVTGVNTENGKIVSYQTKGDWLGNSPDLTPVPVENLVGLWCKNGEEGTRIPVLGDVAMFMQSAWGLILCIGVPLAALITYEMLRYKKANKSKQNDMDALKAELEALKAAQASAQKAENNEKGE